MKSTDDLLTNNAYVDIGLSNSKEMTIKANIVSGIMTLCADLGLSEEQASTILNLSKHDFKDILRGHFHNIPANTLTDYLTLLQKRL